MVVLILAADVASKALVETTMRVGESIPVIADCFSITYVRNAGGAFGLFSGLAEPWGKVFFLGAASATVVLLLVFFRRVPIDERAHRIAVVAIIAGAFGNMIDRIMYGEVVDFLDFYVHGWHWPAFNVADIAITLGVSTLVAISLFGKREPEPSASWGS